MGRRYVEGVAPLSCAVTLRHCSCSGARETNGVGAVTSSGGHSDGEEVGGVDLAGALPEHRGYGDRVAVGGE